MEKLKIYFVLKVPKYGIAPSNLIELNILMTTSAFHSMLKRGKMLHKWIILSQDYFLKTVDLSLRGKKYGVVVALLNLAYCVLQVYKWLLYNVQNFITTDWKFWWCIKNGFSSCWLQKRNLNFAPDRFGVINNEFKFRSQCNDQPVIKRMGKTHYS